MDDAGGDMTDRPRLIIVDDDPDVLGALAQNFALGGYAVETHGRAADALPALSREQAGIVLTDLRMPDIDGLELLRRVVAVDPELPVILMSAHADVEIAMRAMRSGAYDFVSKPFDPLLLQAAVKRAVEWRRVVLANRSLHAAQKRSVTAAIIDRSPAMQHVVAELEAIAQTNLPCLIEGEPGSGVSTIARALHRMSKRASGALTVIDCRDAALPGAESDMFGHSSGAFAGASMPRTGLIERGHRGTLLLDHVEALPAAMSGKIERLVEERQLQPLGSDVRRTVDVRCVGLFQPVGGVGTVAPGGSLFYKLSAARILVPPLRERRADIEPLFRKFFADALANVRAGSAPPMIGPRIWAHLEQHDWPGNVVELEAFARSAANGVAAADSGRPAAAEDDSPNDLRAQMARHEAGILRQTLADCDGDVRAAVDQLRIPRKTLYERLARHGIVAAHFRP
jgi:two-component system, NtrC family, C4-dicarboxylate transport response regulator DctD